MKKIKNKLVWTTINMNMVLELSKPIQGYYQKSDYANVTVLSMKKLFKHFSFALSIY